VIATMLDAMAIRPIMTAEAPILRERTKRVSNFDASLGRLLDDMLETMRDAPGVGLAANQIAVPLQVAVIEIDERITELVNPEIVKSSGEQLDWEGCLSIPGYVAETPRAAKVTVKARDRRGKEFRIKGEELLARALQHEIDHLNGTLYIDHLESLEELVRVREAADELDGADEAIPETAAGI
jgi:peptide deformylase